LKDNNNRDISNIISNRTTFNITNRSNFKGNDTSILTTRKYNINDLENEFYIEDEQFNNFHYQDLLMKYNALSSAWNDLIEGNIDINNCKLIYVPKCKIRSFTNVDKHKVNKTLKTESSYNKRKDTLLSKYNKTINDLDNDSDDDLFIKEESKSSNSNIRTNRRKSLLNKDMSFGNINSTLNKSKKSTDF